MKIKKGRIKGFDVISLIGDMEPYDAERFEGEVIEMIKNGSKEIIIDFRDLGYISSSGLRALLNIRGQLSKIEGRLFLVSLKDKVLDVFKVSKLLNIFEVYKDVEDVVRR